MFPKLVTSLVALPITLVLSAIVLSVQAAGQNASRADDPRLGPLPPEVRNMVLEEADAAKVHCDTNITLINLYDCECYARETLNRRLKVGTETDRDGKDRVERFTKRSETLMTEMATMSECVSMPKIEKYGSEQATKLQLHPSSAVSDCAGRELAVRFKKQPRAHPEYINALLVQVMQSCRSSLPPGATNAQPSTAMAPANTTSGVPSPAAPSSAAQAAKDSPTQAIASPSAGAAVVPFNSYRGFLLTVRDNPQVASLAALLSPTLRQVLAEQKAWQTIQAVVDHAAKTPAYDQYKLNPKRPMFVYEWQTEADEASRTDLVDVFLRTDADWSFVTREPQWDSSFGAIVDAFLFARKSVEGREASFAAQELVPVYKRHLDTAVAKAPTKLFITLAVPAAAYDFSSKSIRFLQAGTNVQQGQPYEGGIELLESTDHPKFEGLVLPVSARSTANYHLFGAVQSMHRADPPSSNPGVNLNTMSPTQSWRSYFSIGSSSAGEGENIPYVEVLALDRQLRLTSIPLDPARAEKIAKAANYATMGTISGLTAKAYFDADRVELSHRTVDGRKARYGVLFARLQRIDIHGPDNELLASFKPESLPAPETRTTTATPSPTKLPPEQTETLAERQAKINQNVTAKTNSIVADLKKKSEAQQAQAAAASQAASQAAAQPPSEQGQSPGASAGAAWQPCGGELRSGASPTAVPVEFVNTSKQPRKLIWFDFAGAKIVAGVLQPGQRAPMQTYMTHAWMIADGSDQCMGTLVISKAGSIEIR